MNFKNVILASASAVVMAFTASNLTIDDTEPAISFYFEANKVAGTVSEFEGSVNWDFNNPTQSQLHGSVRVETLKTGNFIRNYHLRTGSYFNEEAHPTMKFKSQSIEKKGDKYLVFGDLTIKGTTKRQVFEFEIKGAHLEGKAKINSFDYGVIINKNRAVNAVAVTIRFDILPS